MGYLFLRGDAPVSRSAFIFETGLGICVLPFAVQYMGVLRLPVRGGIVVIGVTGHSVDITGESCASVGNRRIGVRVRKYLVSMIVSPGNRIDFINYLGIGDPVAIDQVR